MALTRRQLLQTGAAAPLSGAVGAASGRIWRERLVKRHNPVQTKLDPLSPLSVGNGEFAFTADLTGLQTFPEAYGAGIPLCTQAQWGWHSAPAPAGIKAGDFRLSLYGTHGRMVGYRTGQPGQEGLYRWLRENPHRLHLGRLGFVIRKRDGSAARIGDLGAMQQELDLWSGILLSRFEVEGDAVEVRTACHRRDDAVAVEVESALLGAGRLEILIAFPYGSPEAGAADWGSGDRHDTVLRDGEVFERRLDGAEYFVTARWSGAARLDRQGPHRFTCRASGTRLGLTLWFTRSKPRRRAAPAAEVIQSSATAWRQFWSSGGAVEVSASADRRAGELERRIVLSQYLTAIQCAGSLPPQETGLTGNSWYGKFHLEMHWWHGVHFAYWGRLPLFERSLDYYRRILASAGERARKQGYGGARWPKMTGPDGVDSPSPIGPLLIWQQPHPIYYAELCRRCGARDALARYKEVVFESAEFMVSFAWRNPRTGRFDLGPPVIPAQENHPPRETWNPTFELEYWRWGLETAQRWREMSGLGRRRAWDEVIQGLARLPVRKGVYLAHENCPQTYTERNRDHPSMLAALGVLPGRGVDRETMRRTLYKVMKEWKWAETWGWDYPLTAMTAARLGEPEMALDALLMETPKNRYLANGHNYQRPGLHLYLPGNGGLLTAVALMAAGWEGGPAGQAPGFPAKGWHVRHEGLRRVI